MRILQADEFRAWLSEQPEKVQVIVQARLGRIQDEGHFGLVNRFGLITELKWTSGMRIYTFVKAPNLIVLLGGNKNGQEKDIRKAKKILKRFVRI